MDRVPRHASAVAVCSEYLRFPSEFPLQGRADGQMDSDREDVPRRLLFELSGIG